MVAMTSGGTGEEGGGKTGKTAVGTPRRADSVCARGGGRPASRQVMGECGSGRGGGRHPPPAGGCPPLEWERRWGDTEGRRGEGTADVVGRGGPGGDGGATAAAVRPTAGRRRDGARPPVGGRRGGRYAPRRPTQRLAAPPSDVDRQRRTHPQTSSAARNENQKKARAHPRLAFRGCSVGRRGLECGCVGRHWAAACVRPPFRAKNVVHPLVESGDKVGGATQYEMLVHPDGCVAKRRRPTVASGGRCS